MKPIFFLPFLLIVHYLYAQDIMKHDVNKISIHSEVPLNYTKDKVEFKVIGIVDITHPTSADSLIVNNGLVIWEIQTDKPVKIKTPLFGKRPFSAVVLEPGDNISITYKNGNIQFSGKGSIKFQLENKLGQIDDSLYKTDFYRNKLLPTNYKLNSLNDYLLWNSFLNNKMNLMYSLLKGYKSKISSYAYDKIKIDVLSNIEDTRVEKFLALISRASVNNNSNRPGEIVNKFGLSNNDLVKIYDSTLNGNPARWLLYQAPFVTSLSYIRHRVVADAYRETRVFFKENESDSSALGNSIASKFVSSYKFAQERYSGLIREAYLASVFLHVRGIFHFCGFEPEVEELLADYYAQSKYPEYKNLVRLTEIKYRVKYNRDFAADFELVDRNGQYFTKEKLKNKVAILDFWFTGCMGCLQMVPALKKVEEHFKEDNNVVFLSISIDKSKERWIKSIEEKKYTTGAGINLYTGGLGKDHEMIKKYGVTGYPTLYLIDPFDKISWSNSIPDPRNDDGKSLITSIEKHLTVMKDGPYILYNADTVNSLTFNGTASKNSQLSKKANSAIEVQTDQFGKTFNVSLKPSLTITPSEYTRPERMLIFSDIEGNFEAFRNLLQSNKIIDENYNWIFGNGHLVFAGDMFDRGKQVTECLWLVYSLEEKAKEKGGLVHFILGNHEIMNLQGDESYAQFKYTSNAKHIGKSMKELYSENSELGRWLRTKNIIEKIGDLLVMHGGISRTLNRLPVAIAEINLLARPFYAESNKEKYNDTVKVIMSTSTSPFWYRGYYHKYISEAGVDSTLRKFNVKHIITGHTIVADTISVHYGSKVINTDTKHAEGKSEALLIEGDKFYRVNAEGKKVLLFVDDKRKMK